MPHLLRLALHFLLPPAALVLVLEVRGSEALSQRRVCPVSKARRGRKWVRSPSKPCRNQRSAEENGRKLDYYYFFFTFLARLSNTVAAAERMRGQRGGGRRDGHERRDKDRSHDELRRMRLL